ncbi:MAG TPA: hypothetical protein V6C97_22785 [Oculatellaceae cyanobacterium]
MNHLRTWKASLSQERTLAIVLLALGLLLRLRQYLTNRSLWVDEAMLALNIVNRSFAELFKPLDYNQGAPIGFLLVEKFLNLFLERNELVLRFFPLLAGSLSLWLFYLLLKRTTRGIGLFAALALFTLNPRLVYYSSEVKQYIVDVAVTLALLLVAASLFDASPCRKDFVRLAAAGLFALWFSHPALFVLAGIGLTLAIVYIRRRDYSSLRGILGVGFLWMIAIGLLYFLVLKDLSQNDYMREYWAGAFLPMPPWSDPGWFLENLSGTIGIQFGMPYAVLLVFALMLIGWSVLFIQNREYALVFACIGLVTLAASALQLYPVFERMILFLVPLGLVLLGKAVEGLQSGLKKYPVPGILSALLLTGFLIYGPLTTSFRSFATPKYFEHIRPSMDYLRDYSKPGDTLYVYYNAIPAFRFYEPKYGLALENTVIGSDHSGDPQAYYPELDQLDGRKRVWLLFSHVYEVDEFNERNFILKYVDQLGKKVREYRVPGTSVFLYLYDLK